MILNEKEIQSVLKLSAKDRYKYAMKRILDQEEIWFLDDNGWITSGDNQGNIYLPIWSSEIFAEINAIDNWKEAIPEKLDLEEFLFDSVPTLIDKNIKIAVFPISDSNTTVEMDIISFCKKLNDYSNEWYGEYYDLPYLIE